MRRILLALVFVMCVPTFALAWGPKGHKAIAEISLFFPSDNAREAVEELLGSDDESKYIEGSIWPDQIRNARPDTAPRHFVDIPFGTTGYVASRDCRDNDCVIPRITEFARIAADRSVVKKRRVEALKFVIHFVGDIHQPLHAADDNDRGGNNVFVRIGGRTDKLHAVWDTRVVDPLGATPTDVAESLLAEISSDEARTWASGTPEDWAAESFKIATEFIYARSRGPSTRDRPIILPTSYLDQASEIASGRIQRAGVRLAFVLNQAFR